MGVAVEVGVAVGVGVAVEVAVVFRQVSQAYRLPEYFPRGSLYLAS